MLGFAASRFLKASSSQRYQQRSTQRDLASPRLPAPATSGNGNGTGTGLTDREIGGPTAPPTPAPGVATGAATGTPPPVGLDPH